MLNKSLFFILFLISVIVAACAGFPVREALEEDISIPAGRIEGNQFTGVRYPFKVSAPAHWKITLEFPDFLEELGYFRPSPSDKEQTEVYIYNSDTRSSIQFDLTPAGRYSVFSQEMIESLTTAVAGSVKEELTAEYGKGFQVEFSPTTHYSLKGVQYAARKYATYTVKEVKREQGWIYGFTEPYQIFILYMILEKEGSNQRQELNKILESFEFPPTK